MGFLQTAAKHTVADDARQAREDGHLVFVARILDGVETGTSKAGETIEAVEAAGWRLDHFSCVWVEPKNRPLGLYVFRSA